MYIGETADYSRRTGEHLQATAQHSTDHHQGKACSGCREHAKYRQHRCAAPHRWITVPIIDCTNISKQERKRVEMQLIRRLKPSLNRADKPFWMMREVFATELRRRQRKHKPSGTVSRETATAWHAQRSRSTTSPATERATPASICEQYLTGVPRALSRYTAALKISPTGPNYGGISVTLLSPRTSKGVSSACPCLTTGRARGIRRRST